MEDRLQDEVWRDIAGYEGLYQVSNYGNVRSLEREVRQGKYGKTRIAGGHLKKPTDNGHGYLIVSLFVGRKRKNHYVHRLVAQHFIENSGYDYVNHKDYNTRNNRAENLEWCTQRENILYSAHRMRKPKNSQKSPLTNEKYIGVRYGKFRLHIRGVIDKTYQTLEEAIKARKLILNGK